MGIAMTMALVIRLNTAVLMRKATRSMHVPAAFLSQVLLMGVHWKMLIKNAEEYAPKMR